MNRLPEPYGDCTQNAKTAEYIYRDKEYSTEVLWAAYLNTTFFNKLSILGMSTKLYPEFSHSNMWLRWSSIPKI